MNSDNDKISYEHLVKRLEEVISALEKEGLDLDESIEFYEEGAALYQKAQKLLSSREEKALEIIDIIEKTNPQMTLDDIKEEEPDERETQGIHSTSR